MMEKTRMMKKSFTLIELLVVIAIIAILAGMLLPSLNKAREKARSIYCINNLKTCGTMMALYADSYNEWYLPPKPEAGTRRWYQLIYEFQNHRTWPTTAKERKSVLKQYSCPSVPTDPVSNDSCVAYGENIWLFGDTNATAVNTCRKRQNIGRVAHSMVPVNRPSLTVLFAETFYRNSGTGTPSGYIYVGANYTGPVSIHSPRMFNICTLDGGARSASLSDMLVKHEFPANSGGNNGVLYSNIGTHWNP